MQASLTTDTGTFFSLQPTLQSPPNSTSTKDGAKDAVLPRKSRAQRLVTGYLIFYGIAFAVYFVIAYALVRWHAPYLVYRSQFPRIARQRVATPHEHGMDDWDELWLESKDQTRLHAYYIR